MARNIFWGVSPSPLFPFSPPLSSPFFFVAKQPHSKCSCRFWGTLQAPPAGFGAETRPKTLFGVYRAPRNELSDCRCCSKRLICVALFYGQFYLFHQSFSEPPMPTHNRLFSEPPTFGGMQHYRQSDVKVLHFTRKCGDIFHVCWVMG